MRFAFSHSARSYRLRNHRSRRFLSRHPVLLLMAALLAAVIGGPSTRAATPGFAAKEDFATGANPRSISAGDLNGDGKLDLAVANVGSNSVSVLLNTTAPGSATPSFAAKQDFATGANPVSIAVGDLNGDGKLDLALANFSSNDLSVLLNTTAPGAPTPSFSSKQDFDTGDGPVFVTVGDLNGDGKLDLVVANFAFNTVSVLLNTTAPGATTPSFAAKQDFDTGANPRSITVGDLNGDGRLDIAVVNFNSNSVSVLLNITDPGAATPSFAAIHDFPTNIRPISVTEADLNGDGKLDLAVVNLISNNVSVLLNTTAPGAATPSFAAKQDFDAGANPRSVTVGDLDGDGKLDLAVVRSNAVSVLVNTTLPGAAVPGFAAEQDFAAGDGAICLTSGDLNLDGKIDLAVANFDSDTMSVLLNTTDTGTATPSFAVKQDWATGANPRSVTVGDFNGDGKLDLAVANVSSNTVSALLNTTAPGAATSSFAAKQDFATGDTPVFVTVGDLNRDGKLDLAVANIDSSTVSVLINTTTPGALTPSFAAKQDFATGDGPVFVAGGDLNGDGKLDLVVANLVATVSVLLNTTDAGAAATSFAVKQDFATGDGPRSVAVCDLNGDGKLDLAVVNLNSNSVSVLLNTTNPGAATPSFSAIHDFPTGVRPISITAGDVNADGKLDLAVVNFNSNNVSVLLNTTAPGATTPSFAAKQDFETGANPRSVTVGDLNGDGRLDLAIIKSNAENVSVWVNTTVPGADIPSFDTEQEFAAGDGAISVNSGDLNGDGKPDLVIANFNSDTVSVLLNTPTIVTGADLSLQQGSERLNSRIARVTDFGANGSLDVKVTSANPANGVTISNIVNTDGNILADIVASCGASTATFTLQASDGSSTVTGTLSITVTANTPPMLAYQNLAIRSDKSFILDPAIGPSDNGEVVSIVKQSSGTFTGDINVDNVTGTLSITNPAPIGTHTITIRATDNCGATTDASFTVTVDKGDQTIAFGALENKSVGDPDFAVSATATSGLPVSFVAGGQCTLSGGNTVHITDAGSCTITASQAGDSNFNPAPDVAQSFTITNGSTLIGLSQSNFNVEEGTGFVTITVNRTGDLSVPVSVDYATNDTGSSDVCSTLNSGMASARCDFGLSLGTLKFAANETQKTFVIPITQDSYTEGPEMFTVNLSNVTGAGASLAAPSTASVTINDTAAPAPNTSDDTEAFVRQQYRDFLNREADAAGLAFWTNEINSCGNDAGCRDIKRINVSAAFFLSIEFQQSGNLVRSFYVAALDRPLTDNMPAFLEFQRDTQAVQRGVIVGQDDSEQILKDNRDAFMKDFVTRAEFIGLYPTTDTPTQYVDKLYLHAGITPTADERDAAIAEFGNSTIATDAEARGRALLEVTKNTTFQQREMNRSFVQMQYFGYLRRNPNDAPDGNFAGYDFWVNKLDAAGGNFIEAEMVKAFLVSSEYRQRFGP